MTVSSEPGSENIPSIHALEVKDLVPWAQSEIGSWIEQRCKEGDVASIGYGLGRYWDINMKRAQVWMQIRKRFPGLVDGHNREVEEQDINGAVGAEPKMSKRALLPLLGRSSLSLQDEEAVLRISWKLDFDWTGEVESAVSVETALPSSCEFLCHI